MPTLLSRHLIVIFQSAVETKPVCVRLESHVKTTAGGRKKRARERKHLASHFGHQDYNFMLLFLAISIINIYTVIIISISMPQLLCLQPAQPASEADRGGKASARLCNAVLSSYATTDPKQTPSRLCA